MIAKKLPLWVLYQVFIRIIFREKNATKCHQPKLVLVTIPSNLILETNQLSTSPIAQLDASVLIQIQYSKSKYQKIKALIKANCKQLKATLVLGVKKLRPAFLASKFGEFPFFNGFLDLANFLPFAFLNLDNFRPFNNFPHFSINLSPLLMPPISLGVSILSATSTYNNTVIFSIDISCAAILLKS